MDKLPQSRLLSAHDIILLVSMKLKLSLVHQDLAYRFGVSIATVTDIIMKSLPVIASQVKFLICWPSKEDCMRTMPAVFKLMCSTCRVIIGCTEIFIERPSNLTARATNYFEYKYHNTIKYLIAITPTGACCVFCF
jgi:DDE superfamily endonuclease/Helix-turn-helix of DDE superfamily endonuclease